MESRFPLGPRWCQLPRDIQVNILQTVQRELVVPNDFSLGEMCDFIDSLIECYGLSGLDAPHNCMAGLSEPK